MIDIRNSIYNFFLSYDNNKLLWNHLLSHFHSLISLIPKIYEKKSENCAVLKVIPL